MPWPWNVQAPATDPGNGSPPGRMAAVGDSLAIAGINSSAMAADACFMTRLWGMLRVEPCALPGAVPGHLEALKLEETIMGARKVGGIWFFRCGRARFSFCLARQRVARSAGLVLAQQFAAAIVLGGAVGWWV